MTLVSLEGPAGPVPLQPAHRAPTAYVPAPHHIQLNHIHRRRAGMASRAAVSNASKLVVESVSFAEIHSFTLHSFIGRAGASGPAGAGDRADPSRIPLRAG